MPLPWQRHDTPMTAVLHLTRDFPPRATGGLSTAVGGMVAATVAAGRPCGVISFDAYRPRARPAATAAPAREHDLPVLRITAPSQLPAAHAFAAALRPRLLHLHDGLFWDLAAQLRDACGARTALTVHVAHAHQNRLRGVSEATLSLRSQRRALAGADAVFAPSRAVAALLTAEQPPLASRLFVTPLGVADDARARRAAATPRRDARVLYAGRFADVNGAGELLAALSLVLVRAPDARAELAAGVPENRRADARWRRRFDELPAELRARVSLLGWQTPDRVRALYAAAGVCIVPSWFETFGQVALEAMLHGTPIVAANVGALPELLTHDVSGLLAPPRDPAALAEHVVALLADPARAAALGRAAAAEARARWLWPRVIEHLLTAYDAIA